jgi:carbonic anhydrase/acetyltransferase-like protein (isoleucine patch superfamily)
MRLVMGVPGKVVQRVTDVEVERTRTICRRYRELAERYLAGEW